MTATQPVDNSSARRQSNKVNAIQFATLGLAVFVSDGKIPLIPRYNKLDTEISREDVEHAIADYMERHDGQEPVHVGATKDINVIKRMFRRFPDAVPSIACGPSRLCVLDADAKDNGPELLGGLFEEHGGVPAGVPVIPTQSGGKHFVFADPDGVFTNKAGLLKKNYGTDVRGTGGQFVAPGSIREDGRSYGSNDDKIAFLRAVNSKAIPTLPAFIADKIGQADRSDETVTHIREREVIQALRDADHDAALEQFDPTLGLYDVEALKLANAEFAALYDGPSDDCSTNRFLAARHVMTEWPDMPPEALAVFFSEWAGAGSYTDDKPRTGEYDDRQIAREWLKNQGLSKPSKGDAFGFVSDDDPTDKVAFLANGGTEERWEAWQEQLTREREVRLARAGRVVDQADGAKTPTERLAQRFTYIEDIRSAALRFLDWVVKHVVAKRTASIATGMWGSGKTAVYSDIGLHVGYGFDWCGRKVKKGVVIYVALENSEDIRRRVQAWCDLMERAGRDLADGAFVVHEGPCCLFDPSGRPTRDEKDLIEIARIAAEHYDLPVAMIVIDTLAQAIAPGDDNSSKDAGIFTKAMQRIVNATGANVTALAHPVKSATNGDVGVRGSGALQANLDTVIEITMSKKGGKGTIKAGSKFRIGDPKKVNFGYRLNTHVIGRDEDGEDALIVLATASSVDETYAVEDAAVDLEADDENELAKMIPPDTPADRKRAILRVITEHAVTIAAQTDEQPHEIGLSRSGVFRLVNIDRKRSGLSEYGEPTVVNRLLDKLMDVGEVVRDGKGKATVYKLTA